LRRFSKLRLQRYEYGEGGQPDRQARQRHSGIVIPGAERDDGLDEGALMPWAAFEAEARMRASWSRSADSIRSRPVMLRMTLPVGAAAGGRPTAISAVSWTTRDE
jgi:hypothetical protein